MDEKVEHELASEQISLVRLVDGLIERAISRQASDIHIEPTPHDMRVRYRIDGMLTDAFSLPKRISSELITRLKVLASLRTDIHFAPQDGRFRFADIPFPVDLRISIVPTVYGENAVMRVLRYERSLALADLGLDGVVRERLESAVSRSHGMILATGPTGSGKTSTLYALLSHINKPHRSIITLEDPVEYAQSKVTQVQIHSKAGLTFATGLRALLRQDPDVIMVGEIRDNETASMAANAALTGHLVFTTLHTNDAAAAFSRLVDMKVERYMVAEVVSAVVAQRLVRTICRACKVECPLSEAEKAELFKLCGGELSKVMRGKGCAECVYSGYRGRTAIHEVLINEHKIKDHILRGATHGELKEAARANGMRTLAEEGVRKIREGETTIEELLRVFNE